MDAVPAVLERSCAWIAAGTAESTSAKFVPVVSKIVEGSPSWPLEALLILVEHRYRWLASRFAARTLSILPQYSG